MDINISKRGIVDLTGLNEKRKRPSNVLSYEESCKLQKVRGVYKTVKLPSFEPYDYQRNFVSSLDMGYKRVLMVCHRRWGKDISMLNITCKEAFKRKGTYFYYLPTQVEARKIIWNGMDNEGKRFIDYIPKELVARKLEKDMMIELINGSVIQLIGSDNLAVVGVNPVGCVFSEYALQNPRAWLLIQPILRDNGGWAMFNSTFRGKNNHLYRMLQKVKDNPLWYTEVQSILDSGKISEQDVLDDIESGLITKEMAMQEYFCDPQAESEGAYFGDYVDRLEKNNGVSREFEYDGRYVIHTAWDLGYNDMQCIFFFQIIINSDGKLNIRVIDYYENRQQGWDFYSNILKEKAKKGNWKYGCHLAPHDIAKHESTGRSKLNHAEDSGIYFVKVPRTKRVLDDVEIMRRHFSKLQFNANKEKVVFALEVVSSWSPRKIEKLSSEGRPIFDETHQHCDTSDSFRTMLMGFHLGLVRDMGLGDIKVNRFASAGSNEFYGYGSDDLEKKPLYMRDFREEMREEDKFFNGGQIFGEDSEYSVF